MSSSRLVCLYVYLSVNVSGYITWFISVRLRRAKYLSVCLSCASLLCCTNMQCFDEFQRFR